MDIDLLFTQKGEAGLIANENLIKKAAGIILSLETGMISIEFVDMDYLDLNIPVEPEFFGMLDFCLTLHVGSFKNKHIAQAYQVPLLIQDDPYRSHMMNPPAQSKEPLTAFEYFLKSCVSGQPVHRDDLGNEETTGCILGDSVPSSLQFAPHLARRRNFEAAPHLAPGNAPGLGLGSSGSASRTTNQGQRGRGKDDDKSK